ncbi:MAG: hypothetical protein JSS84_09495 [Bacteroidetes bacterium]|nr:hypothetical protein [Bacteroidota bacterium]
MKAKEKAPRRSVTVYARVSERAKARLRRASKRSSRSMSEELDFILLKFYEEDAAQPAPGLGASWVEKNKGVLTGKIPKEAYQRDDMTGYALRKYARA